MKIFFFNVPTSGHVNPTLPLVAELVRRGHEVTYYLTAAYSQRVEATGATFRAYAGVTDDYFDAVSRRFNPARLAAQLLESSRALLPQLLTDLHTDRPELVIYDSMCPWGRLAAYEAGVTAVASMSLLDLPPSYLWKSGQLPTVLRLFASNFRWFLRYHKAAREIKRRSGVTLPTFPKILNWPGDANICYTSREMMPNADQYGSDYVFAGPPIGPRPDAPPFPFEQLDPALPLIYVSLGTVFNNNPRFYSACVEAFAAGQQQVVISLGRQIDPASLGQLPPYIIASAYVPQLEILQRAALFITHAGANSVHEGLYHGVPLLLAPQQIEQAMVAARVAELGAGLVLSGEATVEQLQRQATRLLREVSFRQRADDLGASLRAAGGAARAADAVLAAAPAQTG